MNKEELQMLYTKALYRIPSEDIILEVDKNNNRIDELLTQAQVKTACLLTAANPYSQELSETDNLRRNTELKKELDKKWKYLDAISSDLASKKWKENGFFVLGMNLKEALTLAGTFGQHAILFYEKGQQVELIFTGAEIKSNNSWKDMLKSWN